MVCKYLIINCLARQVRTQEREQLITKSLYASCIKAFYGYYNITSSRSLQSIISYLISYLYYTIYPNNVELTAC